MIFLATCSTGDGSDGFMRTLVCLHCSHSKDQNEISASPALDDSLVAAAERSSADRIEARGSACGARLLLCLGLRTPAVSEMACHRPSRRCSISATLASSTSARALACFVTFRKRGRHGRSGGCGARRRVILCVSGTCPVRALSSGGCVCAFGATRGSIHAA